jgi:hypothetical protein
MGVFHVERAARETRFTRLPPSTNARQQAMLNSSPSASERRLDLAEGP